MKRIVAIIAVLILQLGALNAYAASDKMVSTADFTYKSFDAVSVRATISFDINANTVSDGIVGIASSSIVPKSYSDYAICFRIRAGGFFDANNGSDFDKATDVYYVKNKTYHVEIDADITNQIYNAFVYVDGEKHMVADAYVFRKSASDLGKITARGGGGVQAGLYYIENIAAEQGEGRIETFRLPNFYTENMVLQRNKPHRIFGKATGDVTVTLSKGEVNSTVTVSPVDGLFEAEIAQVPAGLEPYVLTVSAKDKTTTIENVFVGDVYLLAGQSNMAQNYNYQTTEQLGWGVTTSNLPVRVVDERIKHFTINQTPSSAPTFDVPFKNGAWQPLTAGNNKTLSYIGMFFAEERLKKEPDVPVGIISAAWNGTPIDRWMRKSDDNKSANYTPSNGDIFNNHIAPLATYPLSAVLWYQGESDSTNPVMYEEAFKSLITDWRKLWDNEKLPFLFVQLARYSGDNYAPQRNAQMKALELENTGMAVILDTDKGTYGNIHPLGKETVAQRLHLLARKYVYAENVVAEGPLFEKAVTGDGKITVYFRQDTVGSGLVLQNTYDATDERLCEFEVSDETGYFVEAEAVINSDNTVTVYSEEVENPVYVRYAYSAVPRNANLFNKEGLPASPFTTDARIFSSASFLSRGIALDDANVQTVSFNVTPMLDNINGVMGFTDNENTITAWNSCGITIRFHENGFFEYIDGEAFKTSDMEYKKGENYFVTIIADFTRNTYSLIVDGQVLCENAAFRKDSLPMGNVGRFMIRGGDKENAEEFYITGHSALTPERNTVIKASDGENQVAFALSPEERVFAANYEGDMLTEVKSAYAGDGVEIIKIKNIDKIFVWDENCRPLN